MAQLSKLRSKWDWIHRIFSFNWRVLAIVSSSYQPRTSSHVSLDSNQFVEFVVWSAHWAQWRTIFWARGTYLWCSGTYCRYLVLASATSYRHRACPQSRRRLGWVNFASGQVHWSTRLSDSPGRHWAAAARRTPCTPVHSLHRYDRKRVCYILLSIYLLRRGLKFLANTQHWGKCLCWELRMDWRTWKNPHPH